MIPDTQTTKRAVTQVAMPEWLTRQDQTASPWVIEAGTATRGDAWTNMVERRMRVPTGKDAVSRVIRAHEMMHAKVSPRTLDPNYAIATRCEMGTIVSAEEFRVNMLVGQAGFDLDELRDGSESRSGEMAGESGDWNNAVLFIAACAGTKAADDFVRGMKRTNEPMAAAIREIDKGLRKMWRSDLRKYRAAQIASTRSRTLDYVIPASDDETGRIQYPSGFNFTIKYAKWLQQHLVSDDEFGDGDAPDAERIANSHKKNSDDSGSFARLIEQDLKKPKHVDGKLGRRRIKTNIGRNPRHLSRLLTDPEKRVFDRSTRGRGGVVLIDQSGSMHLSDSDIWDIIEAAPGCVIIGYSHRAGSDNLPNAWVIADRGRVAEKVPSGNGGNGVDGPAIRFAVAHRRKGEPLIWVCDGMVTDGASDRWFANLNDECAELVVKHGIHSVEDVSGAVSALRKAANGQRLKASATGYVARSRKWTNRHT